VDVFEHVERAEADEILVTPTLLKLTPSPPARIVGTLNDAPLVRKVLGLSEATT